MGSADPPRGKLDEKLKKNENMQKKSRFLYLCYILRAIRAGRCGERRYADQIFIQIYFRMHHFVVKFLKFSSPQAALTTLTKILWTLLYPRHLLHGPLVQFLSKTKCMQVIS